ncbi:MAG: GGDEF domain-containing protein [Lachnospiraceae bacterium]|nr:GGDEF domain-containing protein [Lachnospiraceae bacterium]
MEKNKRKCKTCGEIIDGYAEFCVFCGTKQPVPAKSINDKPVAKSNKTRNKIKKVDIDIMDNKDFQSIKKEIESDKTIKEQEQKIKELEIENEKTSKIAFYDKALTGLKNRAAFDEALKKIPKEKLVVIAIDANNLKDFNDNWGHSAGDELLIFVANKLESVFGKDNAYRLGGDEFGVLIESDEEETTLLIEKFNTLLNDHNELNEKYSDSISVSASLGYAKGIEAGTIEEVLKLADQRMYEDKERHKLTEAENKPIEYINEDDYNANFDGYYNDTEKYIEDLESKISKETLKKTILLSVLIVIFVIIYEFILM